MLSLVLTTAFLGITFWLVKCGYWGWLLFLVTMAVLAAVAWQIARNWATISGAIATWWTANWQNAVRWIMILVSLAFAVGIIWMLVPKVPKCAPPGCYASSTSVTTVSPATGSSGVVSSLPNNNLQASDSIFWVEGTTDQYAEIVTKEGWRWDFVSPMPTPDQYFVSSLKDANGDRVDRLYIRAPFERVRFQVKHSRCTGIGCAW